MKVTTALRGESWVINQSGKLKNSLRGWWLRSEELSLIYLVAMKKLLKSLGYINLMT